MNINCIECKKNLKKHHIRPTRCWDCYVKWSQIPENNGFYNKKHSEKTKEIIKQKATGRIGFWRNKKRPELIIKKYKNPNAYWTNKSNKNIIVKHHIDGNKKNNNGSNFLKIPQGEHRSLHWRGYEYLVSIGLIIDYLKDFCLKYEIVNTKKDDGKVVHHIDCDRENNNENNFMYLKDKKIHNKLHQEAYLYLVRINRVIDYIKWFFLRRRKINNQLKAMKSLKS